MEKRLHNRRCQERDPLESSERRLPVLDADESRLDYVWGLLASLIVFGAGCFTGLAVADVWWCAK